MRALILNGPNDFEVKDVPKPEIGPGDLLLKVRACAVCGTDIRILEGRKTKDVRFPGIIGHEIAGVVEAVGSAAKGFKVGDRVSVAPVIPCGKCASCLSGRENACMNRTALGYQFDGGFAEYMRVPAESLAAGNVFPMEDGVPFDEASLIEPLACCVNGQGKARIGLGQTVLIVGAGPIGLMHLQLALAAGAARVIVNEPNDARRAMAAKLGATDAVNLPMDELEAFVKSATGGVGADAVMMAIGVASLVNPLLKLIAKGGVLNLFAGFDSKAESVFDPNLVHYGEITVIGTSAYTRRDYRTAAALVRAKKVDLKALISHAFPLEDFKKAYGVCKDGSGVKVVIQP